MSAVRTERTPSADLPVSIGAHVPSGPDQAGSIGAARHGLDHATAPRAVPEGPGYGEVDGDAEAFAEGDEWPWAAFWASSSAFFMSAVYLP